MSNSKKTSLTIRINTDLMTQIDDIAKTHNRDRTAITVDLLERGLASLDDHPIKSENYVTVQEFTEIKNLLHTIVDKIL